MNRSLIRRAALACTTAALALTSAGAFAQATLTLSDANCLDFMWGGSAGNRTITCVQSTTPLCSVSGPTTGTLSTPIQLNAVCVPAATSWAWTSDVGSGCNATVNQTCSDTQTAAGTVNYKVTGTNGAGGGPQSPAYPVVWSNTAPIKPSSCSITPVPTSLPVGGGSLQLTMNCANGGTPDPAGYVWTGAFAAGMTGAVASGTLTTTTTFTATASNAGGTSTPPASKSVTVATGGGGGVDLSACNAIGKTGHVLSIPWPVGSNLINQVFTFDTTGFPANDALVVTFKTSGVTTVTKGGSILATEYQDPQAPRTGTLSANACDFTVGLPIVGGGFTAFANDTAPQSTFSLVMPKTGGATLLPNTTYYFNMYNNSCGGADGNCNVQVTLKKPSGT